MLMFGAILAAPDIDIANAENDDTLMGIGITILMWTVSVSGVIYSEKIFKANAEQSIFYKNFLTYLSGIGVNLIILVCSNPDMLTKYGFLAGWNLYTY